MLRISLPLAIAAMGMSEQSSRISGGGGGIEHLPPDSTMPGYCISSLNLRFTYAAATSSFKLGEHYRRLGVGKLVHARKDVELKAYRQAAIDYPRE